MHNDFPLAPERIKLKGVEKLLPNLNNKTRYIVHHKILKQYVKLGLKLTKIHRGISFKEEPWLKSYIDLKVKLRAQAKNEFFKLIKYLARQWKIFGKELILNS